MEQLTPNSLSSSHTSVDQWSAPDHAIEFVLNHARTTAQGAAPVHGVLHLN